MPKTKQLPLESAEKEGLCFLRAPIFAGRPGLEHAFMGREGGVSPAPFNSLNFGGDDDPANIRVNIERLSKAFNLPAAGVFTVRQVHGSHVAVVERESDLRGPRPDADAIVTSCKGLAIGVLTADCVPVLFYDEEAGVIAVAHAGWRGFVAGVLRETIKVMTREFGARAVNIDAAIGPHIGPCCYEVSEDLIESFRESGRATEPYFRRNEGIRLDLGRAVTDELITCGLSGESISLPGPCTSCKEGFYSYRRDGLTGRELSFIMMR